MSNIFGMRMKKGKKLTESCVLLTKTTLSSVSVLLRISAAEYYGYTTWIRNGRL